MKISLSPGQIQFALPKVAKGLDQYLWLQNRVAEGGAFENDPVFRRRFNHFYRVRRGRAWQDIFYGLMGRARTEQFEFPTVLALLHGAIGRYEASFASKLYATLDPSAPVIDSVVLKNLGLRLPAASAANRLAGIAEVHRSLSSLYEEFLATPSGAFLVGEFDRVYPAAPISREKKLDLVLWQTRATPLAQPTVDADPPATIDEAVEKLLALMSEEAKRELASLPEEDLILTHMGLGMFVRNQLGLWEGSPLVTFPHHPDDVSSEIVRATWLKLRDTRETSQGENRPRERSRRSLRSAAKRP